MSNSSWQRPDLVPLELRLRYLHLSRALAVAAAVSVDVGTRGGAALGGLLGAGAAMMIAGITAGTLMQRLGDRGRWLMGVMLMGDGLLLTTLTHLTGGLSSPTRLLIVLHLIVVTLIGSYRTGIKLAIWYSLLALVANEAGDIGWLAGSGSNGTAQLVTHLGLAWAATLVTALASAANEREILRRRYDLDALARMSQKLEQTAELHEVAGVVVDHVADTFAARRVALVCIRNDKATLTAGHGLASTPTHGQVVGLLALVHDRRRTVLVVGLGDDDKWLAGLLPNAGNLLLVPMVGDGTVDGVLVVEQAERRSRRIERRVLTTVERFAAHGALAIGNARLHAELVAMTLTDRLTGVANRLAFDRGLGSELERLERTGAAFAFVLCDLDHFKVINDTHGHQVGDDVLVHVAGVLTAASRAYDIVARYGGEEFAVIMPGASEETASEVAERLRATVEASPSPVPVTLSLGVVAVTARTHPEVVIGAADEALYRAKRLGRNRVVLANALGRLPVAASA